MSRRLFSLLALALALTLAFALAPAIAKESDKVIAFAQSEDGARVFLYQKVGPCVGQARFAEHVAPNGDRTPGCWMISEDVVLVSFLDGERGNIPVGHLRQPNDS